jgi:hypothetical protein
VEILFTAFSTLTAGLITDLTSLLLSVITLSFICMGFDMLVRGLGVKLDSAASHPGGLLGSYREWSDDRYMKSLPSRDEEFFSHGAAPTVTRNDIEIDEERSRDLEKAFDSSKKTKRYF